MTSLPIIPHHTAQLSASKILQAERLAETLRQEIPELELEDEFRPLVPELVTEGPALHLDDMSGISAVDRYYDITFLQERARLRAMDGDFVASCAAPIEGYEEYCSQQLGLGSPTYLHPEPLQNPLWLASACWKDRKVRRELVHALRTSNLRYIHPHMGIFAVWELAALLHQASRQPVKVIAPPPGVTKWVNDKLSFAQTVSRLFGEPLIPVTKKANNVTQLVQIVDSLSEATQSIVLKLPDSAGGGGNIAFPAKWVRGKTLVQIRETLKELLREIVWDEKSVLLVGIWESDILFAPSVQVWIPPLKQGPPIIEGLFEQMIAGETGAFVGSHAAAFPAVVTEEIIDRCALLGILFQHLGYVGRCSFDLVLQGKELGTSRIEFIECNGRWGGTSTPMTLMNRLVGDWTKTPYVVRDWKMDGLDRIRFPELLEYFRDDLFTASSKKSGLVFLNPGRMVAHSALTVLGIGDTREQAQQLVNVDFPEQIRQMMQK